MAQVTYSAPALGDLQRLVDFLLETDAGSAPKVAALTSEAIEILENHPLMGHSAEQGLRELVISRGRLAYLAFYSFEKAEDTVLVLAIRHSREAGHGDIDPG